jgi:hypothetical protein
MRTISYSEMIDSETHEMLIDWAIVLRDRPVQGHCRSIEHRYRPEKLREGEEEERRAPRREIDPEKANMIERIVCAPSFPRFNREFLKAHYIHGLAKQAVCRRLGIRFRDFDFEWYRSVLITRNRLQILKRRAST